MAMADGALELLYDVAVLSHLGHEFDHTSDATVETFKPDAHKAIHAGLDIIRHGPIDVDTDSQSAFDLVNSTTVGTNSRHIERKVFKMKELRINNVAKVSLVPTAENAADLFTKPLPNKVFADHRATVYNFAAQRDLPRVNGAVFTVQEPTESES